MGDLRAALLSSRNARVEEIEVDVDGEKQKLRVRQLTMADQGRLLAALQKAARAESPDDLAAVKVQFAIASVVDESGAPLFSKEDKDGLRAQPCAGWIDRVYDCAMRLMSAPNQNRCRNVVEPEVFARAAIGDKPAIEAKPAKVCNGDLMLGAPKCAWCGADVPHPMEASEKN